MNKHQLNEEQLEFIYSADSRETSEMVAEAILHVAGGNVKKANAIWASPDVEDFKKVFNYLTSVGAGRDQFYWGDEGISWAVELGLYFRLKKII